jgi:hypothetical protein
MQRFIAGIFVGALIFGIVVHISRGQTATANIKAKEIRQGDVLDVDVSVDRAPNLNGTLYITVAPDGGGDQFPLTCGLEKDATKCSGNSRMPLEAKLGKWTITKISFQASAPSSEKELKRNGVLSFQVVPHGELILPDRATVSDIK